MIDLYTWTTPNGRKVSVMLEELGLAYEVHPIDINADERFQPWFLKIAPNNRIPAIVDREGPDGKPLSLFESGAILIYLAEKTKSPLLSQDPRARATTIQWLMWQMGGVGPMFGQAHHFLKFAKEDVPYGKTRYHDETKRLYGVMDRRLGETAYLAGESYSIADIATYPWVARHEFHQVDLGGYPNVARWFDAIGRRPAVVKGMKVPDADLLRVGRAQPADLRAAQAPRPADLRASRRKARSRTTSARSAGLRARSARP